MLPVVMMMIRNRQIPLTDRFHSLSRPVYLVIFVKYYIEVIHSCNFASFLVAHKISRKLRTIFRMLNVRNAKYSTWARKTLRSFRELRTTHDLTPRAIVWR